MKQRFIDVSEIAFAEIVPEYSPIRYMPFVDNSTIPEHIEIMLKGGGGVRLSLLKSDPYFYTVKDLIDNAKV
jgi:hypothetical protein